MGQEGSILTERDSRVVLDIYKYRYLSVSQIQRLHFPSLQTTYRRLRALTELGFIKGFTAPHTPENIYYLDDAGAGVAAGCLGVDVIDLKWTRTQQAPKDYYFLRHFLRINDFRIALTQACAGSGFPARVHPGILAQKGRQGVMVKYIKDFVCDIADQAQTLSHTPDAVFALSKGPSAALFFLEIDRGTEVVGNEEKGVLKSVKFYLNYLLSDKYQRYREDFGCPAFKGFRALVVTTTAARRDNMRAAISRLDFAEKAKRFIWLTDESQVGVSGILERIWVSADTQDQATYRIG